MTWYFNGCKTFKVIFDGSFFCLFRKPIRIIFGAKRQIIIIIDIIFFYLESRIFFKLYKFLKKR